MALKDIIESLRAKKEKTPEELVEQLTEDYSKKVESGESNPENPIVKEIMRAINESANPNITARIMLQAVIDAEEMPDEVTKKLTHRITEDPNIANSAITKAVEESDSTVPDEIIDSLLRDKDAFSNDQRFLLIKSVEDEEIFKNNIKSEIERIYKSCKSKRDDQVVRSIKDLQELVRENSVDFDITSLAERVIARKMAENYYDDNRKSTMIYTFTEVIPYSKLWEDGIDDLVDKEFKKISAERGTKKDRFDKKEFRIHFISEFGRDIGRRCYSKEEPIIIPKSKQMEGISFDEETALINEIEKCFGKKLSAIKKRRISEQIHGKMNDSTREAIIMKALREALGNKDENDLENVVQEITEFFSVPSNIETTMQMKSLIKRLSTISSDRRTEIISLFNNALERKKVKDKSDVSTLTTPNDQDDGPGGNR